MDGMRRGGTMDDGSDDGRTVLPRIASRNQVFLGGEEGRPIRILAECRLPYEQGPNPHITPGLDFEFHYFFMRKLWFAHMARAMVVFPGSDNVDAA